MHNPLRDLAMPLRACWVLLVACVVGCGQPSTEKKSGAPLVVGLLSDPATLMPVAATRGEQYDIIGLIFLKLLEEQSDLTSFEPSLAERWEYTADSLTIVFHLRDDVRWQDGAPVTAQDVRFTYELHADPEVAWGFRHSKDRIRDVEVIDDRTVAFHYKERYLYQLLDANEGVIVPRHLLEGIPRSELRTAEFGRAPIGNGPYRLARWETGRFLELERNPDHFEQPNIERVIFRVVPDQTTQLTLLKTGEIDCLEGLSLDAVADLERNAPNVRVHHYLSRTMNYIGYNLEREPFANRDVRRALAMAIDARSIIETVWGDLAMPWHSAMHPILWAHDPTIEPIPYDPDAARRTLERVGWKDTDGDGVLDRDGRPFEFVMMTNQGNTTRTDVITIVQAQLAAIGVRVHARTLEFNAYIERLLEGDFDSFVMGANVVTKPDLYGYWHSNAIPRFNVQRYRNPEVDRLIERAQAEIHREAAQQLWSKCQRIIYEDQGCYFLAIPYATVGLNRRFCGVEPNAISFFANLPEWYEADECPE